MKCGWSAGLGVSREPSRIITVAFTIPTMAANGTKRWGITTVTLATAIHPAFYHSITFCGSLGETRTEPLKTMCGIQRMEKPGTRSRLSPIFTPREDFISIVYNGAMYVIGGWDNNPEADIWTSTNGSNWTQVNPALNTAAIPTYKLGFTPRWGSAATVYNGQMWILQGSGGNPNTSSSLIGSSNGDEWKFDGATLTLVTLGSYIGNLPYPMLYHQITANSGLLWLTPGSAPRRANL